MPRLSVVQWIFVAARITTGAPSFAPDAIDTSAAAAAEIPRAPVVIDGEQLFLVRGITSYPAEQRARDIEGRIRALAADRSFDVASMTIGEEQGAAVILAREQRIMGVLAEDAVFEQVDPARLAQANLQRIRSAIESYRQAREPGLLWRYFFYALGATMLLLAAAYVGRRTVGRMQGGVERR